MKQIEQGSTVHARGRDWTVVVPPPEGVDMLIADPHLTQAEQEHIARVEELSKKRFVPSFALGCGRTALDLDEVTEV